MTGATGLIGGTVTRLLRSRGDDIAALSRNRSRATLDVPRELAWFVAKLLLAERQRRGTPRGSRALNCFWQAVHM